MNTGQKEADRRRRLMFFLLLVCLAYYFGSEALFQGTFLVFVRTTTLMFMGFVALELAAMNILWPIARWFFQRQERKRKDRP